MARLTTRFIRDSRDLVEHFDRLAPEYLDAHGPAERLLAYRLAIIRRFPSPEMVRVACRHAERSPWRARISLRVDAAEELATVEDIRSTSSCA